MNPSELISLESLKSWFSTRDIAQGQNFVDDVSRIKETDYKVTAKVQGDAEKPYSVRITFDTEGQPKQLKCSCPEGEACEHTVATLLCLLDDKEEEEAAPAPAAAAGWLFGLSQLSQGPVSQTRQRKQRACLFWCIEPQNSGFGIRAFRSYTDASGRPQGKLTPWDQYQDGLDNPAPFMDEVDQKVLAFLVPELQATAYNRAVLSLMGEHGSEALALLVEAGRVLARFGKLTPLKQGSKRDAHIGWQQDEQGQFRAAAFATPAISWTLPLNPPWYVDAENKEIGPLVFDSSSANINTLLAAPPRDEEEARRLSASLNTTAAISVSREINDVPKPVIRLSTLFLHRLNTLRDYPTDQWGYALDILQPCFRYDNLLLMASDLREFIPLANGETIRVRRDFEQEAKWLSALEEHGGARIPSGAAQAFQAHELQGAWSLRAESYWPDFMSDVVPILEGEGWQLEMPENFRHHYLQVEDWETEVLESETGWFDVHMGIVVAGQKLALAPLLADLFKRDGRWLDAHTLSEIPNTERVILHTPLGHRVRVAAERLKPMARTLIDLFDTLSSSGTLRVAKLDSTRLTKLVDDTWHGSGLAAMKGFSERLSKLEAVKPVEPPQGFNLTLRTYQKEGLAWLQYLREHNLAGILADDMGLGKTAQTLAHLLLEKEEGRLDKPALVVVPTSLVFNWKAEIARFAPSLSILSLHGKERKSQFENIPKHDVVLTTYSLLWRDAEELSQYEYHLLILDEAQTVKNAASKGAGIVRKLNARHRLCLTGTPLENHLGELWAQFDFLLPGFLGDSKSFTRTWRKPIEKYGDSLRRELLSSRLRPFILRRRKEEVAKELPPKTIMLRTVELEGGQRDLYEIVRAAMDARIREEVAARGFARSHIVILDALLKLRQVCCDPRLVRSEAAKRVKERAKLEMLMEMLPELVEEGSRILIFSQFTSMLALIEEALNEVGLKYVILTGDTKDRETPINRFQALEVPIFLISLKAGGVGLNLTAADTVIHFDPWWNPAAENQATDRAHRLGQTKPVFVYKLVVGGSIEEKIIALQEQKAALAAGILSDDRSGEVKFSEADIQALLAPLPSAR